VTHCNRIGIHVMRLSSYAATVAGTFGLLMSQAAAQMLPMVHQVPHPAPAPLLGAGIPAFFALGGGALIARLKARRNKRTASSDV
jgi:hypothetical protein